ncbi:glutamine synthetase leaf isozyme chloroplastic [Phtheirospermum japonicum]|uniref:glutamine synthetase n=1 Tax=Phtheirospermum japonicum TaxID=374723 RepID=A0A830DD58_9LAMI|nr:glutamine synthetase leaf isozyme chloroplastic [Phtheirospermum japonicum]
MAQILAPSAQWQMRIAKNSTDASPLTSKMWSPLVLKQSKKVAVKSSAKFRVFAVNSDNSTINRLEQLLNLDTISKPVEHPSELPKWNYDGSSTGQAPGEDSEVILYPQAIFKDPFRGGNNILEVTLVLRARITVVPGADKSFGRDISDAHYKACLYAGINISGTNGEVMPGQRITEQAGVVLSLDPKPIETISKPVEHPSELPKWNYDGSSTGQAPGEDSEVILYPQAIFKDPFRGGNNILVICDTYTPAGEPIPTNKRYKAAQIFSDPKVAAEIPWYGIEQEYTLLQTKVKWPLGWPAGGYPGPQGPYYCGAGADKSFGRDISDAHYKACLYAGINISGTNGEVMPGQRITEQAGVVLSLDPKPIEGDWNGAGCHTNYSTKSMREEGGYEVIKKAIYNLSLRHKEHISAYGEGNERRLTGKHETASINQFSWGVANRGCSIRVGRDTEKSGKGYLEDRRPASNMDPYVVTSLLAETTLLWDPTS